MPCPWVRGEIEVAKKHVDALASRTFQTASRPWRRRVGGCSEALFQRPFSHAGADWGFAVAA